MRTILTLPFSSYVLLFDSETAMQQFEHDTPLALVVSRLPGYREKPGQVKALVCQFPTAADRADAVHELAKFDQQAKREYARTVQSKSLAVRADRVRAMIG